MIELERDSATPVVGAHTDATAREELSLRNRAQRSALFMVVLVGSLPFVASVNADPDLWWHVRAGRRIVADRALPRFDDWSFTAAGSEWTNHEWLSDVFMALAYDTAGGAGLLILRGLLFVALVAGLVIAFGRRVRSPLTVFVLVMATVPVLGTFINVRPHSFTYALTVWTVVILDLVRAGRTRWLAALPLVAALWVNLHGGFILGVGLIGVSLLAMLLGLDGTHESVRRRRGPIVATGLAVLGATLLNPFGPSLYGYLLSELTANHSIVSEWQPISGAQLPFFWLYLAVPVVLWVVARQWRHATLFLFLIVSGFQTAQQARFFVVLGLFAGLVAAEAIGRIGSSLAARPTPLLGLRAPSDRPVVSALGALVVVLVIAAVAGLVSGRSGVLVDRSVYPIEATQWLDGQDMGEANLGLPLRWGGYALWHLPEMRVAIDGRNLTVYDDDWVDAYLRAERDGRVPMLPGGSAANVWMLQADSLLVDTLAASDDWHVAYADPVAVVLLPGPDGERETGPAPPTRTRFP